MADPARRRGISPGSRRRQAKTAPSDTQAPFPITDYFVRPSDPLGRSVNITVTAPPDFRRVASVIVIRECFTFQTEGDVMRWCIKYGLAELARRAKDEEVTSEASTLGAWLRAAASEDERLYYMGVLKRMEAMVEKLLQSGHKSKAIELAERVWSTVDRLKDEHWREQYRKRMKRLLDRLRNGGERA